jgi:heme a synthase
MVLLQIYLGALVAGLNAGFAYNTWPQIDGSLIPQAEHLWFLHPLWRNFFENTLTVQFDHRMVAYAIWLAVLFHAIDAWRMRREAAGALVLAAAVTAQALLGIVTLLQQAPISLAQAHQMVAILVLSVAIVHAERLGHRQIAVPAHLAPARARI